MIIKKISNKIVSTSNSLIRKHLQWIYVITTTKPMPVFVVCCLVFLLSYHGVRGRYNFVGDFFYYHGLLSVFS